MASRLSSIDAGIGILGCAEAIKLMVRRDKKGRRLLERGLPPRDAIGPLAVLLAAARRGAVLLREMETILVYTDPGRVVYYIVPKSGCLPHPYEVNRVCEGRYTIVVDISEKVDDITLDDPGYPEEYRHDARVLIPCSDAYKPIDCKCLRYALAAASIVAWPSVTPACVVGVGLAYAIRTRYEELRV